MSNIPTSLRTPDSDLPLTSVTVMVLPISFFEKQSSVE